MPAANRSAVLTLTAHGGVTVDVDESMLTRVSLDGAALTSFDASEILLVDGTAVDDFACSEHELTAFEDSPHGSGARAAVHGHTPAGLRKTLVLTSYEQLPGMVVLEVTFANTSAEPVHVTGWRTAAHELLDAPGGFYTFSGVKG